MTHDIFQACAGEEKTSWKQIVEQGCSLQLPHVSLWLCQNSYGKWPFIVDLPIKNGGSFHSYVSLPEGTVYQIDIVHR